MTRDRGLRLSGGYLEGHVATQPSRRKVLRALAAGLLTGSAMPTYARVSAYRLTLEERTLTLPNWAADGFRLALISDLHVNNRSELERAQEAARMAMAAKPDVILLGGDYVDHKSQQILANIPPLLHEFYDSPCPVYAIMGNHDYWSTVPQLVIAAFNGTRVRMLRNETAEVDGVTIAGIDDAIERRNKYDFFPSGTVSKSLLALFHEPDFVDEMPKNVSLQLSGHSHGGQVCLPFGASLYTPYGARKYVAGFYESSRVPLYVSRGVGTVGPDYRLFCAPEVTVLTLRGTP